MRYRILLGVVIVIGVGILLKLLIGHSTVALLMPQGTVASQERNLMAEMALIMLGVTVPLFVFLCIFAWKYRARRGRKKDEDVAEASHNVWGELALWVIPMAVVAVLWVLTWKSAHALDPYASIESATPPLVIQVVALPWKWLFIYPAQNIATVNFIEFPVNTPVHFELTADAPMSSFWIPQLGSQIYAMAAMETQLNLVANTTGDFTGKDTEINGAGYAGMTFVARSASQTDFNHWVQQVQQTSSTLNLAAYNALATPSKNNPPAYYSSVSDGLFDSIMMKFMMPSSTQVMQGSVGQTSSSQAMPTMIPGMQM